MEEETFMELEDLSNENELDIQMEKENIIIPSMNQTNLILN